MEGIKEWFDSIGGVGVGIPCYDNGKINYRREYTDSLSRSAYEEEEEDYNNNTVVNTVQVGMSKLRSVHVIKTDATNVYKDVYGYDRSESVDNSLVGFYDGGWSVYDYEVVNAFMFKMGDDGGEGRDVLLGVDGVGCKYDGGYRQRRVDYGLRDWLTSQSGELSDADRFKVMLEIAKFVMACHEEDIVWGGGPDDIMVEIVEGKGKVRVTNFFKAVRVQRDGHGKIVSVCFFFF